MAGQKEQISIRILARMLIAVILISFLPVFVSGRYGWWEGWVFGITSLGSYVAGRGLLLLRCPELVADRAGFSLHEGVRRWDRILAPLMASGSLLISLAAALDIRFGWSPGFSLTIQLIALFVILTGAAVGTWAMLENRFFAAMVRIQTDRGHQVISDGPYRLVRHPGYAGTIWFFLAMPFFLDSDWALLPAACMIIVGITRTALEDRTLLEGLPGYRDYARRVRFRLVPGLW